MRPFLLVAFAFAAGCTAYRTARPEAPPINALGRPPSSLAQLCVVRPGWGARVVTLTVHDNDKLVGATNGPSYFCYFAEPGQHRIVSSIADQGILDPPRALALTVEPGGRYYLQQSVSPAGHSLVSQSGEEAAKQIEGCGYQIVIRAPDGTAVPGLTPVAAASRRP